MHAELQQNRIEQNGPRLLNSGAREKYLGVHAKLQQHRVEDERAPDAQQARSEA